MLRVFAVIFKIERGLVPVECWSTLLVGVRGCYEINETICSGKTCIYIFYGTLAIAFMRENRIFLSSVKIVLTSRSPPSLLLPSSNVVPLPSLRVFPVLGPIRTEYASGPSGVGRPSDVSTPPRIGVHLSLRFRVVVESRWKRAFPLHSGVHTREEKVGSAPRIE